MTSNDLLNRLFEGMNTRKLDDLGEILDSDVVFHFPKTAPLEGAKRVTTFLKVLFRKYPTLHFTLGRMVASAHFAAAEWTNEGVTKAGGEYKNAGVTFIETGHGKIIYMSDTFKDTEAF